LEGSEEEHDIPSNKIIEQHQKVQNEADKEFHELVERLDKMEYHSNK